MKKAALLGCGIVGGGVEIIMRENAAYLEAAVGEPVELKYILELRDCSGQVFADKVVTDFAVIENDPEVSVVAECIGGVTVAYDFAVRCLKAGKSFVTCNKQMIAEKGQELLALAKEHKVYLLFEASVGGGIPLLRPLTNCLSANRIDEIAGILNGTSNYILTQMIQCGQDFDSALKDAQRLGYAEADPAADVDGIDALRKLCILYDLSFGINLPPEAPKVMGIRDISEEDAANADRLGYAIKLIAHAKRLPDDKFMAVVAPHLVPKTALLSNVNGVMNAVVVRGNAVGETMFYGAGAGRMPTASAMVADIIDTFRRGDGRKFIDWGPEQPERFVHINKVPTRWYVRTAVGCEITEPLDRAGLKAKYAGVKLLSFFAVLD